MTRLQVLLALGLMHLIGSPMWACSVCYTDPESQVTKAVNLAVWVMIGVTICVLSTIFWIGMQWSRRAMELEEEALVHPVTDE